jgi:hypothetical protein
LERDPGRGIYGTSQGQGGIYWRGEELDGQQSFFSYDASDFGSVHVGGRFPSFSNLVARVMKGLGFRNE